MDVYRLSGKLVGAELTEGLHKANGLELRQPHGAQAVRPCVAWGEAYDYGTGLVEGHLFAYMAAILYLCGTKQHNTGMSAVTAIYHIVINTYHREMTLPVYSSDQLYR